MNYGRIKCCVSRLLGTLSVLILVNAPTFLWAAKEEAKKEPVWVMSWAAFIFFVALTIFFFSHSVRRPETALTHAEQKQVEEEMVERLEAKKIIEEDAAKNEKEK